MSLILLTACAGFHPVYGVNKFTAVGVEQALSQVKIDNIPDREGQFLRNALITRFYRDGRPDNPLYTLAVTPITESAQNLDVTIDSEATRGQLRLSTSIALKDNQNGEVILNRKLRSIASYNILSSEFTNRVSEQNARENTLNDLARQIEEQLALHFKNQK